jgi:predicted Fe-Mo cluster-binding NifX family protein
MKKLIAIPTIDKKLCAHFGHCETFAIVETEGQKINHTNYIRPPVHEPGVYPKFLADKGVSTIIAGGMGGKAQDLFAQNNIEVFMGINAESPETLVEQYLENQLISGDNLCDH